MRRVTGVGPTLATSVSLVYSEQSQQLYTHFDW